MGILDRVRKTPKKDQEAAEAPVKKTRKKAAAPAPAAEEKTAVAPARQAGRSAHVLLAPRVSEKAAVLSSRGVYVFNVPLSANKVEVRKAIESLYGVTVDSVRMVRGIGKQVARGRIQGQRNHWKKALVSLKKGQKIDLYAGV